MNGTSTFSELYLGSTPVGVTERDDYLLVMLANGRSVVIPMQLVSQLNAEETLLEDVQLLLLRHAPHIDHVHVTDTKLNVYLQDGRLLSCPLAWFPRLLHGTPAERNHYQLSGDEAIIHWPDLDEDIELSRLFEGGRSVESERSLQRWLLSREAAHKPELVAP